MTRAGRFLASLRAFALAVSALGAAAAFFLPGAAHAHKASDAYLLLAPADNGLRVRWDIALRDLDMALDLDADRDARLTWGEVRARHADISALAQRSLELATPDGPCVAGEPTHALRRHADGTYATLEFDARCPAATTGRVVVRYRLFEATDPTHRGIVSTAAGVKVLAPDGAVAEFALAAHDDSPSGGFLSFVRLGIEHVLAGWDHLAFLFALLLPAVLRRADGHWTPAIDARASAGSVVAIVTAFTLAHSLTLALAVVGGVRPPAGIVEPAIAASVALAALHNLWPLTRAAQWQLAFGFGLVHGFGFAGALDGAGLQGATLAGGLLGFNLGVEVGQLAAVAVVLPMLWLFRRHRFYRGAAMPVLSVALAAFGLLWFLERVFDLRLIPT